MQRPLRRLRRTSLRLVLRRISPHPALHHPREPLRLLRSNSRKSAAAVVARELPNRASSPPGRAPQHRGAAATLRDKKTWFRNKVRPSKTRRAARLRHRHNGTEVRDKR
jgi:hypothetical protein